MRVADLYAALSVRPDPASWKKADRMLVGLKGRLQKFNAGAGKMLGNGFTAAGLAAGLGIALKGALEFDESLTRLSISSSGAMGSMEEMRAQVLKVSTATGVAKEDLLAGAASFVALTGDGKAATAALETFARISKATGSAMEDISAASAALVQNMGINPADLEKAFSILVKGGKAGAIELKDVAGLMASLSASSQRFAGAGGVEGLAKLGAALQVARQGFGSASETATGLEALMGALIQNASKFKKAGVAVFGKNGGLRDFKQIVEDISESKLVKQPGAIEDALGRKEAIAAFYALTKVEGAWTDLSTATMNATDVAVDYAKYQESSAAKSGKAWNTFKVKVDEAFTPERIELFTDVLGGALDVVTAIVDKLKEVTDASSEFGGWLYDLINGDPSDLSGPDKIKTPRGDYAPLTKREQIMKGFGYDLAYEDTEDGKRMAAAGERHRAGLSRFVPSGATVSNYRDAGAGSSMPGGSSMPPLVQHITVNASNAEGKALAKEVAVEVVKQHHDAVVRTAAAATGR